MDLAASATLATAVAALLTALTAIASVLLTYRNIRLLEQERTATNREMLYSKQMEGMIELIGVLSSLYDRAVTVPGRQEYPFDKQATIEILTEIGELQDEYWNCWNKAFTYLPLRVLVPAIYFDNRLNSLITDPPGTSNYVPAGTTKDTLTDLLHGDFYAVLDNARSSLGIDTLSEGMRALLKDVPQSRSMARQKHGPSSSQN